ncbi:Uromodulin [Frankliniella fusca]|uniref:Uromodulin n=1 Tax=Frankliniella fusca TaxID=407009 RepID=A0AAE1LQ28_9NEOP|nr:Uromodulin [Frankliniella fusca]
MAQNQIAGTFLGGMDRNSAINPSNYVAHSAWHTTRNDGMSNLGEIPPVWPPWASLQQHNKDQNALLEKDSLRGSTSAIPLTNHYKTTSHDVHYAHYSHGSYAAHQRLANTDNNYLGNNVAPALTNARREQSIPLGDPNLQKSVELPNSHGGEGAPLNQCGQLNVRENQAIQRLSHSNEASNPSQNLSCSTSSDLGGKNTGGENVGTNPKSAPSAAHWKEFLTGLRTGHYEMSDTFRHHLDPEAPVQLPEDYGKSDAESDHETAADKTPKQPKKTKVMEAKEALNRGQAHINAKGKLIRARRMGEGCASKGCRFKCEERITKEARTNIFEYFWNLGNHQLQWLFIAMHTSVRAPKQRTQDPIRSRRKTSRSYFFRQGTGKIPVCKTMFLQTLDVSDSWVDTAISKAANGVVVAPDCRGRHTKAARETIVDTNDGSEQQLTKKKKRKKKTKVFAEALPTINESASQESMLPLQNIANRDSDKSKSSGSKDSDTMLNGNVEGRLYNMPLGPSMEARNLCGPLVNNTLGYQGNSHLDGVRDGAGIGALGVADLANPALLRLQGILSGNLGNLGNLADLSDAPYHWMLGSSAEGPGVGGAPAGEAAAAGAGGAADGAPRAPNPKPKKRKRADVSAALGAAATGMGVGVGGLLGAASVPEAFRHHLNPETLGLRDLPNGAVVAPLLEGKVRLSASSSSGRSSLTASDKQRSAGAGAGPGRHREPAHWRANLCKAALNTGKEHVNLKGKLVRARHLGEGCVDSCRFRCKDRIAEEDRQAIFDHFWSLGDHQLQWLFISRHTRVREPKHRTTNVDPELSRRKTTRNYFFTVFRAEPSARSGRPRGYETECEIPVCKTMFLRTLDVSDSWVESAIAKVHRAQGGGQDDGALVDRRGRHRKAARRVPAHIVETVRQHCRLFPRSGIPPGSRGFQRQCLADGHSVSKMHRMYVDWMQQQALAAPPGAAAAPVATLRQYRDILAAELRAEFKVAKLEGSEDGGDFGGGGEAEGRSVGGEVRGAPGGGWGGGVGGGMPCQGQAGEDDEEEYMDVPVKADYIAGSNVGF